jgi:hypothetical protein
MLDGQMEWTVTRQVWKMAKEQLPPVIETGTLG